MARRVTVSVSIRIWRYSGHKQVVVPQGISCDLNAVSAPTALQVAVARGHRWQRQIESGNATTIGAITKAEKVDRSYISRMMNLTTLAPEVQAAILDETLPDTVSMFNLASDTPLSWEVQRGRMRLQNDSPDDLSRPQQQRLRNRHTDSTRSLEIDHQLKFGRLLDWKLAGIGTFEYPVHVGRGAPIIVLPGNGIR